VITTVTTTQAADRKVIDAKVQPVIDEVDKLCREETVYMIGPTKAKRLAELVRKKKPKIVVECGTAIGYSGLWIARELKAAGQGKLITIEIDADRAKQAQANFEKAGLADVVEVRIGDARQLTSKIKESVDFLFIDCNYSNYYPCFRGIEKRLAPGAVVVADNVGIGASGIDENRGVQHIFIYAGHPNGPAGVFRITRTLDTPKLAATLSRASQK
jgi:predicted O-methyltransferase YrrM